MANQRHVDMLLHEGAGAWNRWRTDNPHIHPDLNGAYLRGALLEGADLSDTDLSFANLIGAVLVGADLRKADLSDARLTRANLSGAQLRGANLSGAHLREAHLLSADLTEAHLEQAHLRETDFSSADLTGAFLSGAICLHTDFSGATLTDCHVYGISAWDLNLEGALQADLHITDSEETSITVDNLEVAQFLYLILHNEKVRAILDTITSKVVLILGRFGERKPFLDALRDTLRGHPNGYIPVLFDFEPQHARPVLETVKTLANLARFVIADLTDPRMVRAELTAIIPHIPTVPVQPIIQEDASLPVEYSTWILYNSFLPVYRYADLSHLLANLSEAVITPVEGHVHARRLDHGGHS